MKDTMKIFGKKIGRASCRERIQTVLSKKARYREKAAALLSFGGEKILKRVWNSKFAVKRK